VLVVTLANAVLVSHSITALDTTGRRSSASLTDTSQQQAAAESRRNDVKIHGFRSSVVHKLSSPDDQGGGLTVQDPPKGWPFSEIHVNFNSHMSEPVVTSHPDIITQRPEGSRIKQIQQQLQQESHHEQQNFLHPQQQYLLQQPQQTAEPVANSNGQLNSGFTRTSDSHPFKQPQPYITRFSADEQSRSIPENGVRKLVNEPNEKMPKKRRPNLGSHMGHNFGLVTPSDTFTHKNKMPNVIKQELSTSGTRLLVDDSRVRHTKSNELQQPRGVPQQESNSPHPPQVIHAQPFSGTHNQTPHQQATSSVNIKHSEVGSGDSNYMWRDVSPGLEISSNTPQLAGASIHNPAETRKAHEITNEGQGSATSGQSDRGQSHDATGSQFGHTQNFDHANALGHSDIFGYRDAIVSLPAQIYTGQHEADQKHSVTASQQEQKTQHEGSGYQILNSLQTPSRSSTMTGNVFLGTNKSPGIVRYPVYNPDRQHNQQHQSQSPWLLPQANHGVGATGQKVLKLNRDLIHEIPGPLVLGNGLPLGYASTNAGHQNLLLFTHGLVNAGGHGDAIQAFYIPLPAVQNGQFGNNQAEAGTVGVQQQMQHVQQNLPGTVGSHVAQGDINTVPLSYVGLPVINGGLHGHNGVGRLPIIQGNLLGIQGLHGVVGGTALQTGQTGGNHVVLPNGGLAPDNQNNLGHQVYKPMLQSSLQATGQQQFNTIEVPENKHLQLATGGNNMIGFQSGVPYLHQQVNNEHSQLMGAQSNSYVNGFGVKIRHPHPIPQKNFNTGAHQRLPLRGQGFPQQPSVPPADDQAPGVPNSPHRGYQTLYLDPRLHQSSALANSNHAEINLNPAYAQTPIKFQQEPPQQHDQHINAPTALPKLGIHMKERNAQGRLKKNYLGSKPGKPTGPFSNSVFPTHSTYVWGMGPPTAHPNFITK